MLVWEHFISFCIGAKFGDAEILFDTLLYPEFPHITDFYIQAQQPSGS